MALKVNDGGRLLPEKKQNGVQLMAERERYGRGFYWKVRVNVWKVRYLFNLYCACIICGVCPVCCRGPVGGLPGK